MSDVHGPDEIEFGDADPLDAWDDGDDPAVREKLLNEVESRRMRARGSPGWLGDDHLAWWINEKRKALDRG